MSGTYALREQRDDEPRMSLRVQPPIYRTVYITSWEVWIRHPSSWAIQLISVLCQELTSLFTDAPLMPLCGRRVVLCRWYHHYLTCIVDWDDGTLNRLLAVLIVLIVRLVS